jgi:hypothetical protein
MRPPLRMKRHHMVNIEDRVARVALTVHTFAVKNTEQVLPKRISATRRRRIAYLGRILQGVGVKHRDLH